MTRLGGFSAARAIMRCDTRSRHQYCEDVHFVVVVRNFQCKVLAVAKARGVKKKMHEAIWKIRVVLWETTLLSPPKMKRLTHHASSEAVEDESR